MNRAISTYIDLLRVLAAITVFFGHFAWTPFTHGAVPSIAYSQQHLAVIVFFVISGYVIAFVADRREASLRDFAVSRMARIYSVAIPALILTMLVDVILHLLGHESTLTRWYQDRAPWKYLPLFLTFTQEFWFLREDVFSNVPFWSLSYEVWYYVAFAVAVYLKGPTRAALLAAVLLAMGPRIVLLFPIWLFGAELYRQHSAPGTVPTATARLLFCLSLSAFLAVRLTAIDSALDALFDRALHGWASANLRYSQFALGDYLDGAIVALSLFAVKYCGFDFGRGSVWIAPLAGCSFSLYLYHFPLLMLFGLGLDLPWPATLVGVLACVYLLASVTEQRKRVWASVINRLVPAGPRNS
jgi:peptidoglycan/LPS O-acetylase OafA/YrhL